MSRPRPSLFSDDHEGFGRPPRHTKPRTKDRPDYSSLPLGRVVTIDRGRYHCFVDGTTVTAAKARALGRKSVIVGDLVRLDGDVSGEPGSLARVAEVEERTTVLRRTADDHDPYERPIVANADQLVIVVALADPEPRMGMIDRILVAGYDGGLTPILCLTKADLASASELRQAYAPLDISMVTVEPEADLTRLRELLAGHRSVFIGHSGVGKSTLVNALIPGAHRRTGAVNDVTGKGRHTSTSAIALELPSPGGWVIDTPGVRSFGLQHVDPAHVLAAFADLAVVAEACPRGCTHQADQPQCALDQAVADGRLSQDRVASFRRMELSGQTWSAR
ncbi:MAG: ribosome small subunit-dependent GTPase A [Propionibacteriaceae bacterium]|jgi:ribosome biogenesis GTPase|nr:ribosome small subunit-dependent GTPase A [Propionibacteriaceae bacterium]